GPDSGITGRGAGEILAVALTDVLSDGLSMVYSFFDPDEADRSLGTFMILDHVERANRMGLPYVYLGYWVAGSRKMDYKGRFLPQERLMPSGWSHVEKQRALAAAQREIDQQLDVQRNDCSRGDDGERRHPARSHQHAHLFAVGGEHHQGHDGERQL